jgi:hypothetical protein
MKKYKLLLFLFFATNCSISGQSIKERSIEIFASASIDGTKYQIKITTGIDSIKIRYKIRDSTSTSLDSDKEFNAHRNYLLSLKNIDFHNDTVVNKLNILESIAEKYTFYSKDSIEVSNSDNESYLNLINEVFDSPTDSLNNKIQNKNRIVFDGIQMTFILREKGNQREVHAHSPTAKSHPLLYELIDSSINIYREAKKNDFLNKSRLFGY